MVERSEPQLIERTAHQLQRHAKQQQARRRGASIKSGASTLAGSSDGDAATVEAWGDFPSSKTSASASGGSIADSSGSTDGKEGPSSADSGEGVASAANSSSVTSGNGRGHREKQRQWRRGSVRNENGERDTRERHRHGRKLPRPAPWLAPGGLVRRELGPPVQLLEGRLLGRRLSFKVRRQKHDADDHGDGRRLRHRQVHQHCVEKHR